MKAALGWLGRTGLLYLVLCLAIAFYLFAWPAISAQFSGESLRQDAMSIGEVREQLAEDRRAAQNRLEARAEDFRQDAREVLDLRLAETRAERERTAMQLAESGGLFDTIRPSRILERKRLELRLAALDAEIAALEAAREARLRERALAGAQQRLERYARIPTANAVAISRRLCRQAETALTQFDEREVLDRNLREFVLRERETLADRRDTRCEAARERAERREQGLAAARSVRNARAELERLQEWTPQRLPDPATGLSDTALRDVAWRAAIALLAILLLPFAVRTLFYHILAPIPQKGPPIRLSAGQMPGDPDSIGRASSTSLAVELGEGEELLIRQSFLQSSDADAVMQTRWLLDWRRPLSSLASGLAFLTQARGAGTTFTISAREDPFAEVARIDLPPGAALVLQPRALAAVLQTVDRPLQIRSRWKLFSLHAWLTFQFRYLVFHGPAALIVKGGRGVRIERAKNGRIFGQDQLVGFSAHTAYTIRRNETFQPYLFGREPLFRDRVTDAEEGDGGILVVEEAPMAGRTGGLRGGLENTFDAVLKAFGI